MKEALFFLKDLGVCIVTFPQGCRSQQILENTLSSLPFHFRSSEDRFSHKKKIRYVSHKLCAPQTLRGRSWVFDLDVSNPLLSFEESERAFLRLGKHVRHQPLQTSDTKRAQVKTGVQVHPSLDPAGVMTSGSIAPMMTDETIADIERIVGLRKVYASDLVLNAKQSVDESVCLFARARTNEIFTLLPGESIKAKVYVSFGFGNEHVKFVPGFIAYKRLPRIRINQTHMSLAKKQEIVYSCSSNVFDIEDSKLLVAARPNDCVMCDKCSNNSNQKIVTSETKGEWVVELQTTHGTDPETLWAEIMTIVAGEQVLP